MYDAGMADRKAYERFVASLTITQEMWHDGIGYDTDALSELSSDELMSLVTRMQPCGDWRDVEALAVIAGLDHKKPAAAALKALKAKAQSKDENGLRAAEALADLGEGDPAAIEESIVETLLKMGDGSNFSQALDLSEQHPTKRIKMALLKCARDHATMGVHCAAMLYFHAGLAKEAFDWDHRPFYLRFNADDPEDRARAFKELCAKVGVDPKSIK